MANVRTMQKSYTATKNNDSSGHSSSLLYVSLLTDPLLQTLIASGSHPLTLTNSLHLSHPVLQVFTGTALCAKVDKRVPLDTNTGQGCQR